MVSCHIWKQTETFAQWMSLRAWSTIQHIRYPTTPSLMMTTLMEKIVLRRYFTNTSPCSILCSPTLVLRLSGEYSSSSQQSILSEISWLVKVLQQVIIANKIIIPRHWFDSPEVLILSNIISYDRCYHWRRSLHPNPSP